MPPASRYHGTIPPERAARLERIRELLELHHHPERRVGLLSATNLTRLALRLGAMMLAAGLVHVLLGGSILEPLLAAAVIGAADYGVERIWRRIRERVRRAWAVAGLVVAITLVSALVLGLVAPDSAMVRALGTWGNGWFERQQAALDARARSRRIPVDSAAATDPSWRLLLDSGYVRWGTLQEARAWCAALGAEWRLPVGLGTLPDVSRWPDLGTSFYVWTGGGSGLQIGDGKKPGGGVSGSARPTEVHGVLCLRAEE